MTHNFIIYHISLIIILILTASQLTAQNYKNSVGVVAGSRNGISYKGFVSERSAIQVDLSFNPNTTVGGCYINNELYPTKGSILDCRYWDISVNPNYEYHKRYVHVNMYIGAGVTGGWGREMQHDFRLLKTGVNAIVGFEYNVKNVPLALAFDFRPGYAYLYATFTAPQKHLYQIAGYPNADFHTIDWALTFSLRYTI